MCGEEVTILNTVEEWRVSGNERGQREGLSLHRENAEDERRRYRDILTYHRTTFHPLLR